MNSLNLVVQVVDAAGSVIWAHGRVAGQRTGISSTSYAADGTLAAVEDALQLAQEQARGESTLSHDAN